jgi:hypothetical protein
VLKAEMLVGMLDMKLDKKKVDMKGGMWVGMKVEKMVVKMDCVLAGN